MFEDKGHMWIGTTSEGVFNLKIDEHLLTHPIEKGNITSIYQDNAGELWIGSWEKGLFRVKTDGNIENLRNDPKNPHSISSDFVRSCCEDNLGNIWIGTFNGLNRYNKTTGLFQNHTSNEMQNEGLTHSSIWCIVKIIKVLYGWVLTSAVSITSTLNMKSIPDTKLPFMKRRIKQSRSRTHH